MFVKVIQLMVIMAVVNPFCCCTAGLLAGTSVETAPSHSCCGSNEGTSTDSTSRDSQHEMGECPHQVLREHELAAQNDYHAPAIHAGYSPLLIAVLTHFDFEAELTISADHPVISDVTARHVGSPESISQVYCVYRI
ncbi:MAG: hypothetical protein ACSHX8_07880 [Opitutaceae bacterium]